MAKDGSKESVAEKEMRELKSMEMMVGKSEMRRLAEFVDATNRISGVVLRKAEMEDNFSGVYAKAIEKMVELQMAGGEDALINDESFLRIFGETGG